MILSPKLGYVFIHIPKTGGLSINEMLRVAGGIMPTRHSEHVTATQVRCSGFPSDAWSSLFSFAFVRNPWDRVVSSYTYLHPNEEMSFAEYVRTLPALAVNEPTGMFLQFGETVMAAVAIPQHRYVNSDKGERLVGFIGRFESLARDIAKVCHTIGIEVALPHMNRSESRRGRPYQTFYDDETKAIVAETYRQDIEAFGYKFGV